MQGKREQYLRAIRTDASSEDGLSFSARFRARCRHLATFSLIASSSE